MKYPKRHGQPWSPKEIDNLLHELSLGIGFYRIAMNHERTIRAVELAADRFASAEGPKSSLVINGIDFGKTLRIAREILYMRVDLQSILAGGNK